MNSPDPFAVFGLHTDDGALSQRGVRYHFKRVMKHVFERADRVTASSGPRIPMWKSLFDFEGRNAYATLTSVAKPRTESQMLLTPWSTLIGVTNAVIQYRSPGGTWHEPQRVLSLREGRNIRGEFSIGFALDNTHKIFLSHLQYGLCRTSIVPSFGTQQIHCL